MSTTLPRIELRQRAELFGHFVLVMLVAWFCCCACGASRSEANWAQAENGPSEDQTAGAYAPGHAYRTTPSMAEPPPPPAPAPAQAYGAGEGYGYSFTDDAFNGGLSSKKHGDVSKPQPAAADQADVELPLVVYTGFLQLRVRRLLETIDAITSATEARNGYIESMTRDAVVVRIPAQDFDGVMAEFAELGELLERRVQAQDVTEQFTDVGARLAVAKEARGRLMALLAQVKDVEERLRILSEVKRLTEQIESMESTLATLQNLVDFFTITIELVPLVETDRSTTYTSPFEWVRELSAHRATLTEGKAEFSMKPPPAFVLFDEDDAFHAQAADTAELRVAVRDNEPRGDAAFWSRAVHHEMIARGEKSVEQGTSGKVTFELYVNDDIKPRYYLVAVATRVEDLFVIEAFFPNEASLQKHKLAVVQSLSSFRAE